MEDIRVDEDGVFRCWNCGGKNFTEKRTGRAKLVGGTAGVLTVGVAGAAAPLLAKKRLYCQACGEYNRMGNAQPWVRAGHEVIVLPKLKGKPESYRPASAKRDEPSPAQLFGGTIGIAFLIALVLAWSVTAGSTVWIVISGIGMALSLLMAVAMGYEAYRSKAARR